MSQIIGIGGFVYDFICQVENVPHLGETVIAKEFKANLGGKSANSVVQASLLGNVSVAVIGKVGADQYGKEHLDNLHSFGINTDHVKMIYEAPTSMGFVTVDSSGCNQIVVASGADQYLSPADISECSDMISRAQVVISNLEVPMDASFLSLEIAQKHHVKTILVPAPVPPGLTLEKLPVVDIICPNEIEAGQILGMKVDSIESAKVAVEKFLRSGKIHWPIITLGAQGAVVGIDLDNIRHIAAPRVQSIDTTGAGDSFVGSLAFYLSSDPSLTIDDIVSRSVFIASMSTTKKGTHPSYMKGSDLK